MSSNRNISSTATIFSLTIAAVASINPVFAHQIAESLAKEQHKQKSQLKAEKKLTHAMFEQNQLTQTQALDRTSSHVEKHQSQHHQPQANHGHGRRR
jgi:hypothetical protein